MRTQMATLTAALRFWMQGYLLAKFHKFYWMGLKADKNRAFNWLDPTMPALNAISSYKHWGTPGTAPREPNNVFSPENCGGSNASQVYQNAWGWADYMCASEFVYMCRMMGAAGQIVVAPTYTAPSTNVTFYFNATMVDFTTAEASCAESGGHIAGYTTRQEQ